MHDGDGVDRYKPAGVSIPVSLFTLKVTIFVES
jgi:hypothetical protein